MHMYEAASLAEHVLLHGPVPLPVSAEWKSVLARANLPEDLSHLSRAHLLHVARFARTLHDQRRYGALHGGPLPAPRDGADPSPGARREQSPQAPSP